MTLCREGILNQGPVKFLKAVQWGEGDSHLEPYSVDTQWILSLQLGQVQMTKRGGIKKSPYKNNLQSHMYAAAQRY